MPHCADCLRFYPSVMPSGCPFCDEKRFHTEPWCQFCRTKQKAVEVGPNGEPLRPLCPACGQGPMLPSRAELHRRMTLDIKVLPFVPTKEEVQQALMDAEKPIVVDGTTLGQVSVRRTQGPIELFVQSALIEDYFRSIALTFHGEADHIQTHGETIFKVKPLNPERSSRELAPTPKAHAGDPYAGMKHYRVPLTGESFYNLSGQYQFSMRGFGGVALPPGTPGDRYKDMSFLMATGLTEGVTFRFPIVASEAGLIEILQAVKEGMVAFYASYMRPATHNCIIAIRQESPTVAKPKPEVNKYGEPAQAMPRRPRS